MTLSRLSAKFVSPSPVALKRSFGRLISTPFLIVTVRRLAGGRLMCQFIKKKAKPTESKIGRECAAYCC